MAPRRQGAPQSAADGRTTRERLTAEAAELFRTKGYGDATTRELADRLGLQRASLYHHMSTKEELLFGVCLDALQRITEAVERAVGAETEPLERLRGAARAHVSSALADADLHATMLIEMRSLSPEQRAVVVAGRERYERLVRELVVHAQDAGQLRGDIDAKWLALSLLNLMNWSIFWYHPGAGASPDDLGVTLFEVYLNGAIGTAAR